MWMLIGFDTIMVRERLTNTRKAITPGAKVLS